MQPSIVEVRTWVWIICCMRFRFTVVPARKRTKLNHFRTSVNLFYFRILFILKSTQANVIHRCAIRPSFCVFIWGSLEKTGGVMHAPLTSPSVDDAGDGGTILERVQCPVSVYA